MSPTELALSQPGSLQVLLVCVVVCMGCAVKVRKIKLGSEKTPPLVMSSGYSVWGTLGHLYISSFRDVKYSTTLVFLHGSLWSRVPSSVELLLLSMPHGAKRSQMRRSAAVRRPVPSARAKSAAT